jgi:heat-inducible transcriptional repressor
MNSKSAIVPLKRSIGRLPKGAREQAVLFGLMHLYIKTGKPIGSQTLQENGFESLSSATIRNYCGKLEELGFLKQPHLSGGRVPTEKAFRAYADQFSTQGILGRAESERLEEGFQRNESRIARLIQSSAELLSEVSRCAVFISSPRFDQDFVQDVRLIRLDSSRILAVIITDFGTVRTETISLEQEISEDFCARCEEYFLWRLSKKEKSGTSFTNEAEIKLAQRLYHEMMMRHVVGYLHCFAEDITRCGLARLLSFPELSDASSVVNSLALLEDEAQMRALLRSCGKRGSLTVWIGDELCPHVAPGAENAVLAIPYRINQTIVGSVALLGPMRIPYRELFGILRHFSEQLSQKLTDMVYKFKITFRHPATEQLEERLRKELEDKRTV